MYITLIHYYTDGNFKHTRDWTKLKVGILFSDVNHMYWLANHIYPLQK